MLAGSNHWQVEELTGSMVAPQLYMLNVTLASMFLPLTSEIKAQQYENLVKLYVSRYRI